MWVVTVCTSQYWLFTRIRANVLEEATQGLAGGEEITTLTLGKMLFNFKGWEIILKPKSFFLYNHRKTVKKNIKKIVEKLLNL